MAAIRLLFCFFVGSLAFAASISGRIWIARLNQGLPQADVTLLQESTGAQVAEVRSEDDGAFHFENVTPDAYQLLVQAPGWEKFRLRSVLVAEAQTLTLPPIEPELDGTCRYLRAQSMSDRALLPDSNQTALSGEIHNLQRPVKVVLLRDDKRIAATRSDAAGNFEFSNLAPGDYQLRIHRFGYRTINATFEKVPGGFKIFSDFYLDRCPAHTCVFPVPPVLCRQPDASTDSQSRN